MDTPPTPSLIDGVATLVISYDVCIVRFADDRIGFFDIDEDRVCLLVDTGDDDESLGVFV